jgi:hypothetical protein
MPPNACVVPGPIAAQVWRVGAPPPGPPPFVAPTAGYGAPPPGPRRGFPWLWVLLGCGCLLLILVEIGRAHV